MLSFWQWLTELHETYYSFNPAQYNRLFEDELEQLIQRVSDPAHRQILERMREFEWVGYIVAAIRHAGFQNSREVQEKTHEVVVKLLMGKLFTGFDERVAGPMDLRFKRSVANSVKNITEKERNRKRLLPTIPIGQTFQPGTVTADDLPAPASDREDDDERLVHDFRRLVRRRLGNVGVAVLDVRLAGGETKSLVGSPELGSPGRDTIKRRVQDIKQLAREYAGSLGDPTLLRRIEKAMSSELETNRKRQASMAARG
jgi:hypothetical protein